ncbi:MULTISPECIES: sodium:alanine symporter family protein [unclassified Actinomyces]|uniref:alanine/glycine:cation symporter family protein n=1 Tax=unclassified Actinomyces TaxID=2609248 RepID=UPI002017D365|nr:MULTISPECIES: sodium:alanine symporter family protein [unclassified Actinomyces]MCL3777091.1 sodium:alanine symporter family protein [Actinomyces sp. AC-20-1]MCL3789897.1 sodium:alanine symporter family protein [Actinomyces sp. 187325]MCL3792579.1 sodium:alanine symporter family protein [Actinomyces sp. 186855]MCL3794755.1 sodium:alanine symporter family protein [Actinomyces sp. 217892]
MLSTSLTPALAATDLAATAPATGLTARATSLAEALTAFDNVLWGPWLLIWMLLGTGVLLTWRLRLVQVSKLLPALRFAFLDREDSERDTAEGDISHYQALTTALAATVGTGNIVGVATAVHLGGPGALFWMWLTAFFGMASKYAEAFLAVRFRETDASGHQSGGPQYYLKKALPGRLGTGLSVFFAVATLGACLGIGTMVQSNSISEQLSNSFRADPPLVGILLAVAVGAVLLGGIESIGRVTSAFVPLMIVFYVGGCLWIIGANLSAVPEALWLIVSSAFTGHGATGGFLGSTMMLALQYGAARGIFSNESGMGSAAIAAASARTHHPARQGLVSMTQTFIDTMVVVSCTGLVILTTGTWTGTNPATMTAEAFTTGLPGDWGHYIVSVAMVFLGASTILGWAYYGERCAVRLAGVHAILPFRLVFVVLVFLGTVTSLGVVWTIADIANGLMAVPNLLGLVLLSGLIARETRAYLEQDPDLRRPGDEFSSVPAGEEEDPVGALTD